MLTEVLSHIYEQHRKHAKELVEVAQNAQTPHIQTLENIVFRMSRMILISKLMDHTLKLEKHGSFVKRTLEH